VLTNGDEIVFVKVAQTESPQYALSRVFATLGSEQEVVAALKILRGIGVEALL
jgi:hypothetical protein